MGLQNILGESEGFVSCDARMEVGLSGASSVLRRSCCLYVQFSYFQSAYHLNSSCKLVRKTESEFRYSSKQEVRRILAPSRYHTECLLSGSDSAQFDKSWSRPQHNIPWPVKSGSAQRRFEKDKQRCRREDQEKSQGQGCPASL